MFDVSADEFSFIFAMQTSVFFIEQRYDFFLGAGAISPILINRVVSYLDNGQTGSLALVIDRSIPTKRMQTAINTYSPLVEVFDQPINWWGLRQMIVLIKMTRDLLFGLNGIASIYKYGSFLSKDY